ncbi:UPF0307 protein [Dissostichus eleginoides]|uniref:UPF0307 protein n=1 Tax=Dissostichus eleginoides TaxID=100907 RepID=A0AAD9B8V9_DISEL|nr:UPF0307 protein [Dissostichus eleginoides]
MSSKGAEIARRYRERLDADPDRRRKYLEKRGTNGKKTERLERRRVSMSLVRERRGQKKEMERGKKSRQSQRQGQCFATVRDTTRLPAAPENQPEPGLSRQQRLGASAREKVEEETERSD